MCHSSSLFPTIVNSKYTLNTRTEDQNLCPTPSMRRCFTSNPYDTGLSNDQNVSDFYIFKAMCHSSSHSLPSVDNKKIHYSTEQSTKNYSGYNVWPLSAALFHIQPIRHWPIE